MSKHVQETYYMVNPSKSVTTAAKDMYESHD
jgi:hypothetical protein